MEGSKRIGLVIGALALGAGLLASQVSAGAGGTLSISSRSLNVGEQGLVELRAIDISELIGAWTIEIVYDPAVVTVVDCAPNEKSVCYATFTDSSLRLTGASAESVSGDFTLASVTLQCETAGASPLSIAIEVWASAGIGQGTTQPEIEEGTITCMGVSQPTATEEPAPTAIPVLSLPDTGIGAGSGGSDPSWLMVMLASLGLATIVGFGAVRLYEVRWRDG